jgi:hypothetical protein
MRPPSEKFALLEKPRRVWAIAAIHGDIDRLAALHDNIATRFAIGDRLVYLGNYLGDNARRNDVVFDELLAFRSALLAKPGMEPADIVHLRGTAEEAWQRLLRLQFAPTPSRMIELLLDAGVESYLNLYGIRMNDAQAMARADSITITRWTNQLRAAQRLSPGHEPLVCSMKRAAVVNAELPIARRVLFVPAGFNASRTLEDQGDHLWFAEEVFMPNQAGSLPYARIVRGFDPGRGGVVTEGKAVTLDAGCGYGGPLMCGCFDAAGKILEIVAIGGEGNIENMMRETRPADTAEHHAAATPAQPEDVRPSVSAL